MVSVDVKTIDQSVWFDSVLDTLQVRPLPRCYHTSLGALVLSMLHKEPQHRPGAGQVRQALQVGVASALQSQGLAALLALETCWRECSFTSCLALATC